MTEHVQAPALKPREPEQPGSLQIPGPTQVQADLLALAPLLLVTEPHRLSQSWLYCPGQTHTHTHLAEPGATVRFSLLSCFLPSSCRDLWVPTDFGYEETAHLSPGTLGSLLGSEPCTL